MKKKNEFLIALDAGHGYNTPGKRTPDNEREWSFNNKVLLSCKQELEKYENVRIVRLDDASGKTDIPLIKRTNKANDIDADLLISIHHNAYLSKWGNWGGVETYVYRRNSTAEKLANKVNTGIVKAMGLRNRGVLTKNLHMLRESNMTAILTEGGFMDSITDIKSLRDDEKLRQQGIEIAKGVAQFYKLKLKNNVNNKGDITMDKYNELKKLINELDNKINTGLNTTQKKDMKNLLVHAYKEKIFTVDHSNKVDTMKKDEALELLISYISRTIKK